MLEKLRARHERSRDGECIWCFCDWPCDARQLADAYDVLAAAAREALRHGNYAPLVALLEADDAHTRD
jgi:hypothetical protein